MHSNIDIEKAEITHSYSKECFYESKEQDFSLVSDLISYEIDDVFFSPFQHSHILNPIL